MKTKTWIETEYALCKQNDRGEWRAVSSARYKTREEAEEALADFLERAKHGNFTFYVGSKALKRQVTTITTEWEED